MAQFQSHSSQFRCDGGDPIREALPRHGGHGCRPQSHEDTAASSVAFHRRDDHRSRTRPLYQFIHDLAKPGPQCETDHVCACHAQGERTPREALGRVLCCPSPQMVPPTPRPLPTLFLLGPDIRKPRPRAPVNSLPLSKCSYLTLNRA
jgi:hypothetical protein